MSNFPSYATFARTVEALRTLQSRTPVDGTSFRLHSFEVGILPDADAFPVSKTLVPFSAFITKDGVECDLYGRIYRCGNGYHCVSVWDVPTMLRTASRLREPVDDAMKIWAAPIVWDGPRAAWDTQTGDQLLNSFVEAVASAAFPR